MLKCVNKFEFRDKTLPISKKQGQTSKNLPSTVVDSKPKKKTILDDMSDDEEVDVLRLLNEVLDVEELTEEDKQVLDEYCTIIGKFKSISSTSCKCLILKNLSVAIKAGNFWASIV